MIYTLNYMLKGQDVGQDEDFDSFEVAMARFNHFMKEINEGDVVTWVSINAGAWGFLVEYDRENGLQMFREVDPKAVRYVIEYLNKNG